MVQETVLKDYDQIITEFPIKKEEAIPRLNNQHFYIQNGWKAQGIRIFMWLNIGWLAFRMYRNPVETIKTLRSLFAFWNKYRNKNQFLKNAVIDKKYYLNLNTPGWPSQSFNRFVKHQIQKSNPSGTSGIQLLMLAITNKCGFQCEHCFEWNQLNKPEKLSSADLLKIVHRFQEAGVAQIQLSGGEPLNRFNDILFLLKNAKEGTHFWVYSSGYSLSLEKAKKLKEHGLKGIIISIDHHMAAEHDRFRGVTHSYQRAHIAARHALNEGLAVALSCCVTRNSCTTEDLEKYMLMAKELGVAFVQMLEPRAVGHYEGKDVCLRKDDIRTLEAFYEQYSQDPSKKDFPILTYHNYHIRRAGCHGSARDYVYVDTNGNVQSCPFCSKKWFSALDDDLLPRLKMMKAVSCG